MRYSVSIQFDNVDKIYVAYIPELQGCMAHGQTEEQALAELKIACELWEKTARETGKEVPEPHFYSGQEQNTYKYKIIMYWSEVDQRYVTEVPDLPGCMSDGKSPEEAINNTQVIIEEWIETAENLGEKIPEPTLFPL